MAEVDALLNGQKDSVLDIEEVESYLKTLKWPLHHRYGGVCSCVDFIEGNTRVRYIQPRIPQSFKPKSQYVRSTEKFPNDTVYRRSYEPIDKEMLMTARKVEPPKSNLSNTGQFAHDTTHRMSYGPVSSEPAQRFYPREYDLLGKGPMQDVTSYHHDYTAKQVQIPQPFCFNENIGLSDSPLENNTTHRMSYSKIDLNSVEPPISFRPKQQVSAPNIPFPRETVYNTSYQPIHEKPQRPVKCLPQYSKPELPMDGSSIYARSYLPPGEFVREENSPAGAPDKGCYCVYPGECFVEEHKRAHDYSAKEKNT